MLFSTGKKKQNTISFFFLLTSKLNVINMENLYNKDHIFVEI